MTLTKLVGAADEIVLVKLIHTDIQNKINVWIQKKNNEIIIDLYNVIRYIQLDCCWYTQAHIVYDTHTQK